MVRWLEKQGYDVAYVTNIDIDSMPELLAAYNRGQVRSYFDVIKRSSR